MEIYIFIYFFILINAIVFFILPVKNSKIEKFLFTITLIGLVIFSGTRHFTGVDYESYLEIFKGVNKNLDIRGIEKLFLIIVYFSREFLKIELNKIFLLFEAISGILFYRLVNKNLNKNLFFALYIWYSFYFLKLNMGQFRFGIAILICLNLISYLYDDSYKKFFIGVVISFFIHKTSVIYFVLRFIKKKIFQNRVLLIFPLVTLFIGKVFINRHALLFVGNLTNSIKLKSMAWSVYSTEIGFSFYQFYMILISILLCLYKTKNFKITILKKIFSFGVGMYFLFINLAIFSDRMSLIFIAVQVILFPMIINSMHKKMNRIFIFSFVSLIGFYLFFSSLINNIHYVPYRSWLFL